MAEDNPFEFTKQDAFRTLEEELDQAISLLRNEKILSPNSYKALEVTRKNIDSLMSQIDTSKLDIVKRQRLEGKIREIRLWMQSKGYRE